MKLHKTLIGLIIATAAILLIMAVKEQNWREAAALVVAIFALIAYLGNLEELQTYRTIYMGKNSRAPKPTLTDTPEGDPHRFIG